MIDGEGAAPHPARHQFGDIRIDGDDLDADADPGDEAPQQYAIRRGLAGHHHRGRAIAEQREGEDGAAAEFVGEEAEEERADEQSGKGRGDKGADPGKAEKSLRCGCQQAAAVEARRDVAGEEEVVDLEPAAERQQDHQPPDIGRGGQGLQPPRDFVGSA